MMKPLPFLVLVTAALLAVVVFWHWSQLPQTLVSMQWLQHVQSSYARHPPPTSRKDKAFLFVAIGTAAGNRERRRALRESWLRWIGREYHGRQVRYSFFTDLQAEDAMERRNLEAEMQRHGDLVVLPTKPGRQGFGYRGVALLQYVDRYYDSEYLLRMDDDSFLCLPKLVRELADARPRERFVWGKMWFRKGSRSHPNAGKQRLDESFLLFSQDVAQFLAEGTRQKLLAFDGEMTFAVNLAFWSHFLNLTIFDDRERIDSQQHYVTRYMHQPLDPTLVANGTYRGFCDRYLFGHHVHDMAVMAATFDDMHQGNPGTGLPPTADYPPILLPRQGAEYWFRMDLFSKKMPRCECRTLAMFLPRHEPGANEKVVHGNDDKE